MNFSHSALELKNKSGCSLSECNEALKFFGGSMIQSYEFLSEYHAGVCNKHPDGRTWKKLDYLNSVKEKYDRRREHMNFDIRTYTDCGELEINNILPSSKEEMEDMKSGDGDGMVSEMFDINGIAEGDFFGETEEWEVMKTFSHIESSSYWFYIRHIETGEYQVVNLV